MLKTHWKLISAIERISDNLIIVLAFVLAYFSRDFVIYNFSYFGTSFFPFANNLYDLFNESLDSIDRYLVIIGVGLPVYNASLSMLGAYRSMRFSTLFNIFQKICVSAILVFFSIAATLFLLKIDLSRSFVGLFCLLSAFLLFIERTLVLVLLRFFRAQGKNYRNLMIVGSGNSARELYLEIIKQKELGVNVVGFVDLSENKQKSDVYDLPVKVIANFDTFEKALKKNAVDEVVFTDIESYFSNIKHLATIAVEEGVQVTLAADFFSLEIFQSEISYFGSIPMLHYTPSPGSADSVGLLFKRILDFFGAFAALIISAPFLLIFSLLIKLDSPGPVLFKQKRVGKNGRIFTLYKFRSMSIDAEKMLESLQSQNEMKGPVFKLKNDPRVTRFGKFIRKYSIDELPQLFNVLKGDMSLVGPRPPIPQEVVHYRRKQRKRLSMRPGLTCTWQVSGRNEIPDFEEWAQMDLEYIDNWSLLNDFVLIAKTIPVVLSGSGAR